MIAEAIGAGWIVEAEFVAPGAPPVSTAPTHELAPGVLERVVSTETPQPNVAVVEMRGDDWASASLLDRASFVLVADAVGDPGNLGTIIRSVEAAGGDAVVVTPGTVDSFNPKVVRSSAGALFHVPVISSELAGVASAGLRLYGTSSHRGVRHTDVDWAARAAIIVGNEARGLDPDAPVDEWVTIAHRGRAESVNVAMAATVLCFELARARGR